MAERGSGVGPPVHRRPPAPPTARGQEADAGYRYVKLDDDVWQCAIAWEVIGDDAALMIDANQVWDIPETTDWVGALAEFKPLWIEEPTSPDDILGHSRARGGCPHRVTTGEHGMNQMLFKQLVQAEAIDHCQLDDCRLSSVNEVLAVLFMAAKSGIAGLTKALANEWAAHGIGVNAIAPGYIATDNTQALRDDSERSRAILERIPAGRWGRPEDIAGATVFLASAASDYVSGTVLPVDGGWLGR
ncbi:SDR family oxidoreductase [Streptomyces sp. BRA346]|uniref:SDR family oxidoreductase n=1 Tax=Streptomyces sp. BRA346 TaxID=2878199 RepID=UPI004062AACD